MLTGLRAAADLACKKPDNAEPCKPTQQVKQRIYNTEGNPKIHESCKVTSKGKFDNKLACTVRPPKRCRLSWPTNSALVYKSKCGGRGGSCGISANEYSCTQDLEI